MVEEVLPGRILCDYTKDTKDTKDFLKQGRNTGQDSAPGLIDS